MTAPACSDADFVEIWRRHLGHAKSVSDELGVTERSVLSRRRRLEAAMGEPLLAAHRNPEILQTTQGWTKRLNLEIEYGKVAIFSDAHYMPGPASVAHRGLVKLITELQPDVVIGNGDLLDGASISRHPPLGWNGPKVKVADELKAVSERLGEVSAAARKANRKVKLYRTRGNHDARFDIMLATHAAAFEGVKGFSLQDHIPEWQESMSIMVNDGSGETPTMIKHRWHNGIHATYNNLLKGGAHIVTGHLHRLKVEAWGDYRGRRYAVDTGTLADIDHEEFEYTEDNAVPWGSGFAVLTFHKHKLLPPEIAEVMDNTIVFRGEVYKV